MNDTIIDQDDDQLLNLDISDEALEEAAGNNPWVNTFGSTIQGTGVVCCC